MVLIPLSFGDIKFAKVNKKVSSKAYYYVNFMIEQGFPEKMEISRWRSSYYYLYITMVVTRNPVNFLFRRWSMLSLYSLLTFGVYGISNEDIGERMTYLITITLIFTTYLQVLSESIPEVAYYTYADILTLFHTGLVFLVTVLVWVGSPKLCDLSSKFEINTCLSIFVI